MIVDEQDKEFNLLDEPWIVVKTESNETKTWSILEVFQHAHEAQSLAGELPTQDLAIMRLLLAIMHAAFIDENIEDQDDAVDCWTELWKMKQFPMEVVQEYLEQYRERFWLFHPTQPFYQSANIVQNMKQFKADKGKKVSDEVKWKTAARLMGDLFQSDNAPRLFPGRTGNQQAVLSYGEAARWLLHLNGFDDDSAKMPTPKGVGYLGKLGLVYATGKNLFETLMLNFVLEDHRGELFSDNQKESKAYWEKPICENIENKIAPPKAQKDLLTLQSRRIFLHREQGMVTGYLLTMGDYLDEDASMLNEMMTTWKNDEKKGIVPKKHQLECQIWRDFPSLVGMSKNGQEMQPGVVCWLRQIQKNIPELKCIRVTVTGASYSLKGAGWQIVDYVYDNLSVNATLLAPLNETWVKAIVDVLEKTKQAVLELGKLSFHIVEASGDSDKNRKKNCAQIARESGYHHLDKVFRNWLRSLDPERDILSDKIEEWLDISQNTLLALGDEMLKQCAEIAIVGRKNEDGGMNAIEAYRRFKVNIAALLG